ncbi:MAG: MOSC domain-containing protein, partial [Bacteroidota bacterium]
KYDRRWVIAAPTGQFMSQRNYPQMSLLRPEIQGEHILIRHLHDAREPLKLPLHYPEGKQAHVKVWKNQIRAVEGPAEANAWIADFLGEPARFVYMPDGRRRIVDPKYAPDIESLSFADGFPHLVISEASLHDLNQRLETPVPMDRFRPNLVVAGSTAYAEDTWARFSIGEVEFAGRKPCSRCGMVTVSQDKGEKTADKEPFKTLGKYRRKDTSIFFGENLIHLMNGRIAVGDEIAVLETKPSPFGVEEN